MIKDDLMRKKNDTPEIITLSLDDMDEIKARFLSNTLGDNDKKIILTILTTYQWLQAQLRNTKFSILRLRRLFGFKNEKHKKLTSTNNTNMNDTTGTNESTDLAQQSESSGAIPPKKQ